MRITTMLVVAAVAGCGEPAEQPKADGGSNTVKRTVIDVSGTAHVHPAERAWREAPGGPGDVPSLEGANVRVEGALDALLGRPALATAKIGAGGAFAFTDVDVTNAAIAIVASVDDDAGTLALSGFGLARKEDLAGDLTGKPVFAVTKAFVQQLATAIGRDAQSLETNGFILGQVVNAQGQGVAGAQIAKAGTPPDALTEGIAYLNAELSGTNDGATSASGVFVLTPAVMGRTEEYTAVKDGSTFDVKLSGTRAGAVVSVFVTEQAP